LVSSLSRFEAFLGDVLIAFFGQYPMRMTERVQNIPPCPSVSAAELIEATDRDFLLRALMENHVQNVFRQRPSVYLDYLCRMLGIQRHSSFDDYFEIAATRDLLVHNKLKVNSLYLEKAGAKARGAFGSQLTIDKPYFYSALGDIKRVSGAIKGQVERKYGTPARGTV
jgi:hypothetical protein